MDITVYLSLATFVALADAAGFDVYEITNADVALVQWKMFAARTDDGRLYVATKSPLFEAKAIDPSKPIVLQLYHKADKEELE